MEAFDHCYMETLNIEALFGFEAEPIVQVPESYRQPTASAACKATQSQEREDAGEQAPPSPSCTLTIPHFCPTLEAGKWDVTSSPSDLSQPESGTGTPRSTASPVVAGFLSEACGSPVYCAAGALAEGVGWKLV